MRRTPRLAAAVATLGLAHGCAEPLPLVAPRVVPPAKAEVPPAPVPPPSAEPAPSPEPDPAPSPEPGPPVVPPELASAPAWISRDLHTGRIYQQSTLRTYTLRRKGDQVLFVSETRHAENPTETTIGAWEPESSETELGTSASAGGVLRLKLADRNKGITCTMGKVAVAGAHAFMKPDAGNARHGHWVPVATSRVDALLCSEGDEVPDAWSAYFAFVPAPGIEQVVIHDDEGFGAVGWRRIPKDGSVVNKVR